MEWTREAIEEQEARDVGFLKRIIALVAIAALFSLIVQPLNPDPSLNSFLIMLLSAMIMAMVIIGASVFTHYSEAGFIPLWKPVVVFIVLSILIGSAYVMIPISNEVGLNVGYLGLNLRYDGSMGPILTFGIISGVSLLYMLAMTLCGFGIMGVIGSVQRLTVPFVIKSVEGIRFDDTDDGVKKVIAWVFAVPDIIDTSRVRYLGYEGREYLPQKDVRSGFLWVMVFAAVIAVYVSLNPLILVNDMPVEQTIPLATAAMVFVPLIILPWFGYKALDARVEGHPKDYLLYKGFKGRMTGLVAISTAALFFLIGLKYIDLPDIWDTMLLYILVNMFIAASFTFIYFNNVETTIMEFLSVKLDSMRMDGELKG